MSADWVASVRTIEEAREFVLRVGICGILHDAKGSPTLWAAIDAPDKAPNEPGWGEKMGMVWSWKNELPARYPNEIYYGKRKSGAMLCSMATLCELYSAHHIAAENLSETAQRLLGFIAQNPVNNGELKLLTGMTGKAHKSAYDRALTELQVTFNIVRVNRTDTDGDTWTLFRLQYPDFA